MKRFTIFLALLLLTAMPVFSEHVEMATAKRAAEAFLQSKMGDRPEIGLLNYPERGEFPNFYVFGNDQCFVIIAADNAVRPVLGYSTETTFCERELAENVRYWLEAYNREISLIAETRLEATDEIHAEWDNLLNGMGLEPVSRTSVSPLIMTRWDQNEPYNNLCPADGNSTVSNGRVFAGCVATAMAQIMNYWEHPVRGTGSHSYNHPTYGNQSANFGSTTYNWDNMKNSYSGSYTSAEATAVATLVYHCGVAVDMDYNPSGSGATSVSVPSALTTYFNYGSGVSVAAKSNYTSTQWTNLLKTELNAARPVFYSGSGGGGGHAFVCDGYNENNYFHFNWGWSGYCDGYYLIGALNPGPGGAGSGSVGQYNNDNIAITNWAPATPSISAPTVTATVNGRNVSLSWNSVSGASTYKVYRNGNLIHSGAGTSYSDNNVPYGTYSYYVKSVKSDGTMSLSSNVATVQIVFAGPVPTNLQANASGNNVNLTWTAPASETTTLQYSTSNPTNGYGIPGYDFYWAQRFPAATLANYAGMAINKVSVCFLSSGTYTLFIYKGDENSVTDLVYQTNYTASFTGSYSWKDINIANPVFVDYTQDLWVVMFASSSLNISYPAATCAYTGSGNENASLYSSNGSSWYHATLGTQTCSWLMKTYMTDGTYTYKLYRNGTAVANNLSTTSYTDSNLSPGTYNYYVTTNYYGGESSASNQVSAQVGNQQSFTITVSADPAAGGSVTGSGTYVEGSSCTLTATANTGYTFVNWTKNGQQVSQNATYTFTVTEGGTYVAHFTLNSYTITATANPTAGGTVTGGGNYNHGASCTLTATANAGYTFTNWTKNGQQVSTNPNYTFTVTEGGTYVANFTANSYTISVSADPTAGGTVTGGGNYNHGASCTLTATANAGYTFVNWTKNGQQVSTNATYTFTVTEGGTYVAHFQQQSYTISVSADPTAGGTVTGGGNYNHGASCTLTATANTGYTFVNWTKNGQQVSTNATYTFTVTSGGTYVAHFQQQSYTISVSADPTAGGTVTGGGNYTHGSSCTLTATANTGYNFVNWTKNGQQVSTNATYTFTVTEGGSYVAHFTANSYTISVSADPTAGGNVTGGGTYTHGSSCTLTATANTGYTFVNWTKNGQQVSTNATYTFTVTGGGTYVAHFISEGYVVSASADPEQGGVISGSGGYTYGQTCTLTATANAGYTFINWTENGTQVSAENSFSFTVTSNRTFVAHFQAQGYTVSVSANPAEGGTVTGGGSYTYGQTCTVTATANTGYTFINWTENGTQVSAENSFSFTVTGSRTLVANFTQQDYEISAMVNPEGAGDITGTGTYHYGETANLSVTPNPNYTFDNWTENGQVVSESSTYSFVVEGPRTLVANFTYYDGLVENTVAIEIYPNPVDEVLNIDGTGVLQVRVYDGTGHLMEVVENKAQEVLQLGVQHYEPAVYVLVIYTENGTVTRSFVKR